MILAEIFKNGMIFQANKPIRVFGEADGDIHVSLGDNSCTTAAVDGRFLCELAPMTYGGPYTLTVESRGESVTLTDIYVGEVILFTGQSNVQFQMKHESTPASDYRDDPLLRIFNSRRIEKSNLMSPCDGWVSAKVDNIGDWSALAYLVGRRVREKGCAVGVVDCSQGASVIQTWIDEKVYIDSDVERALRGKKLHGDHTYAPFAAWNPIGVLFHFMLEPLMPYVFGNVVWYQGESNASIAEGEVYLELLSLMIANHRERFDCELPFTVVQIADFITDDPGRAGWKLIQQAQLKAETAIANVRTVISADVCESDDIHPKTKWKLADRIVKSMRDSGRI